MDQLVTIGMRKMDGVQKHCDELGIDCVRESGEVDPTVWREEITEIAESREGTPPLGIK